MFGAGRRKPSTLHRSCAGLSDVPALLRGSARSKCRVPCRRPPRAQHSTVESGCARPTSVATSRSGVSIAGLFGQHYNLRRSPTPARPRRPSSNRRRLPERGHPPFAISDCTLSMHCGRGVDGSRPTLVHTSTGRYIGGWRTVTTPDRTPVDQQPREYAPRRNQTAALAPLTHQAYR